MWIDMIDIYSWVPIDFNTAPSFMEYVRWIFSRKHYGKNKKHGGKK